MDDPKAVTEAGERTATGQRAVSAAMDSEEEGCKGLGKVTDRDSGSDRSESRDGDPGDAAEVGAGHTEI